MSFIWIPFEFGRKDIFSLTRPIGSFMVQRSGFKGWAIGIAELQALNPER